MPKSKIGKHLEGKQPKKSKSDEIFEQKYELEHADDDAFHASEAKREVLEEKKEKLEVLDVVDSVRKNYYQYFERLADYGNFLISRIDLPKGFLAKCIYTTAIHKAQLFGNETISTPEGVLFVLYNGKANYIRGMKVTRDAEYDINAVELLANELENTVDFQTGKLEGKNDSKPSGLIL